MDLATAKKSAAPATASNAELFAALWGVYLLLHELKQVPWPEDISSVLVAVRVVNVLLGLALICWPHRAQWLAAVSLAHIVSVSIELPAMSNCWLFSGLLSVGILGTLAMTAVRLGRWQVATKEAYQTLSPTLRWSLIVLYLFAALAKYNWDFFDPQQSCAAYLFRIFAQSARIENVGNWLGQVSIIGTLVFETGLPILFCFSFGRRYAIVVGLAFHTFLAHNHNLSVYDFNAMLAALYVTFLPPEYVGSLRETADTAWAFQIARNRQWIFLGLVLLSLVIVLATVGTAYERTVLWRYRICLWFILGVMMTIIAARTLFGRERITGDLIRPFRWPSWLGWLAIILISLNGAAPYLGYKTAVAYTMYSNLRTENRLENHLFIPAWLRIGRYQDNLVKIESSSAATLSRLAEQGEMLVLHDLRMLAAEHPEASVNYELNGERRQVSCIGDDPLVGAPPCYWERKLLFFRTIPTRGQRCQW